MFFPSLRYIFCRLSESVEYIFHRIGAAMKRAVSPDDLPDVIVKRKERRRRWDVLPNGVKLDTADESEQTASPTESQSNLVKFEIIKAKEQSIVPKIAKATDRKDAFRKLSFGTEEVNNVSPKRTSFCRIIPTVSFYCSFS